MILRAAFWVALVAVLLPHEPDLGLGRPSLEGLLPAKTPDWLSASVPTRACEDPQGTCVGGLVLADDLRSTILTNLDRVKAELKESELARADQRRSAGTGLAARLMDF
ncbi:MAG: hypothetical protein KGI68_06625 [Alphaproteobacteria bacterium]|nr:hypothetical protein [Alphaproteobacteria bacterium]MDE1985047.1 hypothetical protein [Alphaproteobacteria bacterium]MDE2162388.1 hypothetical protein [Alphaproteobacteria bacterium]MDE2265245.1 hypothetical protein [Alphaproteobacteria bacterium]MDE2498732.1 hypothetical protein [Alphaproteobacteria bacterium]